QGAGCTGGSRTGTVPQSAGCWYRAISTEQRRRSQRNERGGLAPLGGCTPTRARGSVLRASEPRARRALLLDDDRSRHALMEDAQVTVRAGLFERVDVLLVGRHVAAVKRLVAEAAVRRRVRRHIPIDPVDRRPDGYRERLGFELVIPDDDLIGREGGRNARLGCLDSRAAGEHNKHG